jgi:FtsZ-binding cell division protein ZapB
MEETPNFSNPSFTKQFVQNTQDAKTLLQKEIDVLHSEQNLLQTRLRIMSDFINDIPSSDPQYSMILLSIQMDQIELDELNARETLLSDRLNS